MVRILVTVVFATLGEHDTHYDIAVGHGKLLDHQDKKKKEGKHVGLSMRACPVSTLHVLLSQSHLRWLCTSIYQLQRTTS